MLSKAAKHIIGIFFVLLVISLAALLSFPFLYHKILKNKISLKKGSLVLGIWEDIPIPIYQNMYFFNITNGKNFLNNEEPLNITEVGPYTYAGKWIKPNPIWNANGTITYREKRIWNFVSEKSIGSQEDIITTLNGPLIVGANMMKQHKTFLRSFFSTKFKNETLIIQKKIRELAYDGYEDPIVKYARKLKPNFKYKEGIFSWLYGTNATDNGEFIVFDGVESTSLTNIINVWNRNEKLSYWKADSCNLINGTNSEMGPPQPDNPKTYTFFQPSLCRTINLEYTGDQVHFGVLAKRFELGPMVFANSSEFPNNACFEVQGERASGVLDVSTCNDGAPVILSLPHFHMADASYLKNIVGLSPNSLDHGSYLDAEQNTGLTVNISIKFQLNLQMERINGVLPVENAPEGIFPVFWSELHIQITEEWGNYLKNQLNNPKIIGYSVLGSMAFGSFVLINFGFAILYLKKNDNEDNPLLNKNDDEMNNISNEYLNQAKLKTNYGGILNKKMPLPTNEQISDLQNMILSTRHTQEYPLEKQI